MANGIELAKAYVQIVPTTTGIKKDLENEMQDAGSSAGKKGGEEAGSSFGDTFKTALNAVGAVAATAVTAATTAIVGMTKSAVESYAEYEQLTGGVETLFGDAYESVMKNANEAFKTAGMSANQYMETVTSFSASLLQGLGGDTAAAADLADQALIDMADNANKMGTDMESIQNAYQGFAKQNYTMLDNLKLGYGGTESEMIRLINDSGVLEETISDMDGIGFDTIIEAIHAVQDNMGITGTTSSEASSTIQGSISQMSAAWTNFLTGAADENQDFDALIDNLIDSVLTVADNLVPRIIETLPRIVEGVTALVQGLVPELPGILEQILPALVEGASALAQGITAALPDILAILVAQFPAIVQTFLDVMPMLLSAITDMLPVIGDAGIEIASTLIDYAVENMPTFIPKLVSSITNIAEKLTDPDSLSIVIDAAIKLIFALADGLIAALPDLAAAIPQIIINIVDTMAENFDKVMTAAVQLILALAKGLIQAIPQLVQKIPQLVSAIVRAVIAEISAMINAGSQLVHGLWSGISGSLQWIKDKISGWVGNVTGFIKNLFGIHSPSTVFAGYGKMLDLGLAQGIEDNVRPIREAMSGILDETSGTINSRVAVSGSIGDLGAASSGSMSALIGVVETLGRKMEMMQIVLDSGVMIGTVDAGVGRNTSIAARGVALA